MTTKIQKLMTCLGCGKDVDYKEVKRVYGEFLADSCYCSAKCKTQAMLKQIKETPE